MVWFELQCGGANVIILLLNRIVNPISFLKLFLQHKKRLQPKQIHYSHKVITSNTKMKWTLFSIIKIPRYLTRANGPLCNKLKNSQKLQIIMVHYEKNLLVTSIKVKCCAKWCLVTMEPILDCLTKSWVSLRFKVYPFVENYFGMGKLPRQIKMFKA
jgi:hypothetical protein